MEHSLLNHVDLSQRLKRKEYESLLAERQEKFLALRLRLGGQIGGKLGPPLLILFEGWDAAGKGGCIRRLTAPLDPRHFSVFQYQAPNDREKTAPLSVAVLAGGAGQGRHVYLSTARGTAACWW